MHDLISQRTAERLGISEELVFDVVKKAQWSLIKDKLKEHASVELTGLGYFNLRYYQLKKILASRACVLKRIIQEKGPEARILALEKEVETLRKKLIQYYESETYSRGLEKRLDPSKTFERSN